MSGGGNYLGLQPGHTNETGIGNIEDKTINEYLYSFLYNL